MPSTTSNTSRSPLAKESSRSHSQGQTKRSQGALLAAHGQFCPAGRWTLKPVVHPKLHQPRSEGRRDNAKGRAVDVLIAGEEGRMVGHVERVHPQFQRLLFADRYRLEDARIKPEKPRSIE